jgi:hypothetical protein
VLHREAQHQFPALHLKDIHKNKLVRKEKAIFKNQIQMTGEGAVGAPGIENGANIPFEFHALIEKQ